jgi:methionine synthase II (cobalamin-independent)
VSAEAQPYPWPVGSATGVGSMPGTDPAEAVAVVLGELPGLPNLPELPARGPGADLTGRTASLLVGLAVEITTSGWRFAARPGRDQRRASGFLQQDLDALEQAAGGLDSALKIGVCGPWTLAATIELSRSQNPALADPGAVSDLAESLAEGVAAHVAEVRKRVPAAPVLLQLDEPALPAVLAGTVPTASGLNRIPAVDPTVAVAALRTVLEAAKAFAIVHCCAPSIPFHIVRDCGAGGIGFDLSLLRRDEEDGLAETVESGLGILAGVMKTSVKRDLPPGSAAPRDAAAAVIELWRRIGLPDRTLAEQVVITPACGLAGESPAGARDALARCREAARILPELIEEGRR